MDTETAGTIYRLSPEEIVVLPGRVRKEFSKKDLEELAQSIKENGQIQPGVCHREDGKFILDAGERRLRACEIAGVPYEFTLKEETSPLRLLKLELEENLRRVNLSFIEEAEGIEKLHRLLQEEAKEEQGVVNPSHGIRETAAFLGKSAGSVAENLELAQFLNVKEVKEAKNKTEAKKVIKKMKEMYDRAMALKEAQQRELSEKEKIAEETGEEPPSDALQLKQSILYYKKHAHFGSLEDVVPSLEGLFDVVLFDPPWGVGFDQVKLENAGSESYEDSPENFLENIEKWLRILWDKMSPDSHLYMFFGIAKHELVYTMLERVGFSTNRIPIIWYKRGAHRTRNPDQWPGRSYEPIAFARKGKKILVKKGAEDLIATPPMFGSVRKVHPSAKHPAVYLELLQRSCLPGDRVLDPMSGSGAAGLAADALTKAYKLDWHLVERKKIFYDLGLTNLLKGYSVVANEESEPEA